LKQLHDEYDDIKIKLALAKLYQHFEEWSVAIEIYQLYSHNSRYNLKMCIMILLSLLNRNHYLNEQGNSDVVEALQRLGQLDHIQQQARYEQLTVVQLP
jgi:hypothetical protein